MCSMCCSSLSPVDGDIYLVMVETWTQHGWERIKGEACFFPQKNEMMRHVSVEMHINVTSGFW